MSAIVRDIERTLASGGRSQVIRYAVRIEAIVAGGV
jgi:hypothetical protein